MKLVPVRKEDLDAYLPAISWHLDSFAERSGKKTNVEDYIASLRNGHRQLWIALHDGVKAAALTEVADDRLSTVRLTHCAGENARDWVFLVESIKAWAKERGSGAFEAICRPGWEKYLKNHGFTKTHIVMEADL